MTARPPASGGLADRGSIADVLDQQARRTPDRVFLRTLDDELTYRSASERVHAYAAGLRARGFREGDRAVLMMANSVEQVLVWFALNRVAIVSIPVNPALTGALLERAVTQVDPALCIADSDVADVLLGAFPHTTDRPLFIHGPDEAAHGRGGQPLRLLAGDPSGPGAAPNPLDPAVMLFTSGSTGVPKACVLSHHYLVRAGQIHAKYLRFTADDVLFTPFPLFHIDAATLTVSAALAVGATAALSPRFSASRFWDEVEHCRATVINYMGATANILWKQPPSDRDRRHRVRLGWGVPMPSCEPGWADRFGFPLVEVYGLTDAGLPAYQSLDEPRTPGSCGRVIDEYQVTIQDAQGDELPTGAVGEICIRSDEPGLLMNEYFGMPEQTAQALRGGWFHTGDLGHLDAHGRLYFHSRGADVIRRRGENIAATDIEAAIDAHPGVAESAAIAVPSELSEDDVKVCVVPQQASGLTAHDVVAHCRQLLPRHMVPRYVELMGALPKTPTEKIDRRRLADDPFTPATHDFATAGVSDRSAAQPTEVS